MHTHILCSTPKHIGNVIGSSGSKATNQLFINPSLQHYIKILFRHARQIQSSRTVDAIADPLSKTTLFANKTGKRLSLAGGELIELIELLDLEQRPLEISVFSSLTQFENDVIRTCRPFINDKIFNTTLPPQIALYEPPYPDKQKGASCFQSILKLLSSQRNSADLVISMAKCQLENSVHWLLIQVAAALSCQRVGGTLIMGLQNSLLTATHDVLYFLSTLYGKIEITKSQFSDQLSGDKLMICRNFLVQDVRTLIFILGGWIKNGVDNSRSLLNVRPPRRFTDTLIEINASLGQKQLESIRAAIASVEASARQRAQQGDNVRISKCEQWCLPRGLRLCKNSPV